MSFDEAVERARRVQHQAALVQAAQAKVRTSLREEAEQELTRILAEAAHYLRRAGVPPTHVELLDTGGWLNSMKLGALTWRMGGWLLTEDARLGRLEVVNKVGRTGTYGDREGAQREYDKRQSRNERIARRHGAGDIAKLGYSLPTIEIADRPPLAYSYEDVDWLRYYNGKLYYNSNEVTLDQQMAQWVAALPRQ